MGTNREYDTPAKRALLFPYFLAVLIACIGIIISLVVFHLERQEHQITTQSIFEEQFEERFLAISSELKRNLAAVKSTGAFFDASGYVDPREFSIFATHFLENIKSIQALEWIPRVPGSERERFEKNAKSEGFDTFKITEREKQGEMVRAAIRSKYFPVYYIEPIAGNEKAIGFDLGSNDDLRVALDLAMSSGQTIATSKITLVQETEKQLGFLVIQPVYRNEQPLVSQEDRNQNLKGFTLGVFRLGDLLEEAMKEFPPSGLVFTIFDHSNVSGPEHLLSFFEENIHKSKRIAERKPAILKKEKYLSKTIDVAGRSWEVICTRSSEFYDIISPKHEIKYLVFSLIITIFITGFYVSSIDRTIRIKKLVQAKTIEIEQAKIDLEIRVKERTKQLEVVSKDLNRLIETANIPIIGIDNSGAINRWNKMASTLMGYTLEEVMGKNFAELLVPEDRIDDAAEMLNSVLNGNELVNFETSYLKKNKEQLRVFISASPQYDEKDNIKGLVGMGVDITEMTRTRAEMERTATELTQLIDTANAPIFGVDVDGNINEWNQMVARITGYIKDEVIGKNLVEQYITDEYKTPVKQVLDNALKGTETDNYEVPLFTKAGERVMVLLNATTRRDTQGNIVGVVGVGQDITELSEHRENLEGLIRTRTDEMNKALLDTEKSRDRIDGILKSVADGLIVTDVYNRVILMNRVAEDLLGVRFSEVIDRPIDFAIDEQTLRDKVKDTLNKKTTGYQFDFELPSDDPKHPRIMRARTSIIHDKADKESGIVTIIHDVTHEREVDRMKTEFISTAAHELRTPLTSIQGFSEIKFLTYINKQSVGLAGIINDLLDISRIESGHGFALNKTPCNAGKAIEQIIPYFQEQYKEHQFEVILPGEPVELNVDKEKMGQVLKNLLSNAAKYSPDGGLIRVVG
ncbi:MAG: PAS domain S-box protein, partial [Deltaproteobacteria bacterium]|nr:PAS domain S-box protein [Deltaproteobacteria bacterium]